MVEDEAEYKTVHNVKEIGAACPPLKGNLHVLCLQNQAKGGALVYPQQCCDV